MTPDEDKKKAAPKKKATASSKAKKPAAKKPAAKKPAAKKPSAAKKTTAKKPAAKKTSSKGAKKEATATETAEELAATASAQPASKKKTEPAISSIRIRLSAFDHMVLDEASAKIIENAERSGAVVHGPIPLPTKIRRFSVLKSTFKHKYSQDQYEMRTHRRLIDLKETTFKTMESLQSLSLPSGVDIEIKMG